MDLLIVRHAIAVEHTDWKGRPDGERPLTDKGRDLMKRNAAGLAVAFPNLDLIATSPLVRAAQTAAVLKGAYKNARVEEVPALTSGAEKGEIAAWLKKRQPVQQESEQAAAAAHQSGQRIALVGHEPDLGQLISWLITGQTRTPFEMRKGGACLLRLTEPPGPGSAVLRWFLPPSLLRKLGR
ncbi:MAG TPA: histidine phosphatase family protein [Candidatus Limnocylindrales bacterium]|nr:histidine phosphatase family protein [Candidatus Limnocylindrales bacterium]